MQGLQSILEEFAIPPLTPAHSGPDELKIGRRPRVVLFDIYGTLVAPFRGDLEEQLKSEHEEESFVRTAERFGFPEGTGSRWSKRFFEEIEQEHTRCRTQGIMRAEVLVERIWQRLLAETGKPATTLDEAMEIALYREMAANPVSLFEGLTSVLKTLQQSGFILGLASNSQFYTLPILERLLTVPLHDLFDPGWLFLSYRLGFAKPDPHFFRLIRTRALRAGMEADEVLMVGNDFENDVRSAMLHGIQAVHFVPRPRIENLGQPFESPVIHNFESLLNLN